MKTLGTGTGNEATDHIRFWLAGADVHKTAICLLVSMWAPVVGVLRVCQAPPQPEANQEHHASTMSVALVENGILTTPIF